VVLFLSSELKSLLNAVADENGKRERIEFMAGIDRYTSLLQKVAGEKKLDVTVSVEGIEHPSKLEDDMVVLEKAHLVACETKYTHRNTYREYTLTAKGAELTEKLSKER
jgi:hypothetical protein